MPFFIITAVKTLNLTYYLMVAEIRERLAVSKQKLHSFHVE
jgi:hypothetical protein